MHQTLRPTKSTLFLSMKTSSINASASRRPTTTGGSTGDALHPLLQFTNRRIQAKVQSLISLPIEPNRYPSRSALEQLGLWDEIYNTFNKEGWKTLIDIWDPRYKELIVEFLALFMLDKKGIGYERPGVVQFRLGGRQFAMSISEFGVALGVYRESFLQKELY